MAPARDLTLSSPSAVAAVQNDFIIQSPMLAVEERLANLRSRQAAVVTRVTVSGTKEHCACGLSAAQSGRTRQWRLIVLWPSAS